MPSGTVRVPGGFPDTIELLRKRKGRRLRVKRRNHRAPANDEAGLPGLYFSYWHALWGLKGTPKNVVDRLNAAIVAALADPAVARRLADLGQEIFPRDQQTPPALAFYQKAEIDKWSPIIKAANIKGE